MAESRRGWRTRCRMRWSGLPAAVVLACVCGTSGCATVTHHRIQGSEDDQAETGVRYLGTSPYLIAYSDGKGGIVTQVAYLPDPNKKMSAKPTTTLADVDSTLEFDRGVLTSSVSKGDATAVPIAIAKAVEAFAPALLAAMGRAKETKDYTVPAPYIFKIVVNGPDVYFMGGQGDQPIKITLLPQDTKAK